MIPNFPIKIGIIYIYIYINRSSPSPEAPQAMEEESKIPDRKKVVLISGEVYILNRITLLEEREERR